MNTWCLDAGVVLTETIEDFYDHFASMNELASEREITEGLRKCIGKTGKGCYIVRTRQGLMWMKKNEMRAHFGNMRLRYISDAEPTDMTMLSFIQKKKGLLALLNEFK
jgi:hypothetical protein